MRIQLHCMACMMEEPSVYSVVNAPLNHRGVYPLVCSRGHHVTALLQQSHWEVLAEAGVQAMVDGYYRDAVLSFASSFERFQQHVVEIVAASNSTPTADFEKTWKAMAAQAERQHGAYLMSYLLTFRSSAPALTRAQSEFRNKVAHKGVIPTMDEAIDFAQAVTDAIHPTYCQINADFSSTAHELLGDRMSQIRLSLNPHETVATHFHPMFFTNSEAVGSRPPSVLAAVQRRMLADGGD